jgi:hypothetical protein
VPRRFVVPESEEWREEMWGKKLGNTVNKIRSSDHFVRDSQERRQWLEEAGFRFETAAIDQDANDEQWEKKMTDVFVRDSQERRLWLEEAGFRFEIAESNQAATDEQWEKKVMPAITTYKVHGDLQVPSDFVVPSSGEWEEGLWNMRLGAAVTTIRSYSTFVRDRPDRQKQLEELGFVWDEMERQWEVEKEALATYKQIYGDLEVKGVFKYLKARSDRRRRGG